jgi:hypothetical protein
MASTTDLVYGEAADFYSAEGWSRDAVAAQLGIGATTTDDELNAMASVEFQMARDQGQVVSGIYSYLRGLRDEIASHDRR